MQEYERCRKGWFNRGFERMSQESNLVLSSSLGSLSRATIRQVQRHGDQPDQATVPDVSCDGLASSLADDATRVWRLPSR